MEIGRSQGMSWKNRSFHEDSKIVSVNLHVLQ